MLVNLLSEFYDILRKEGHFVLSEGTHRLPDLLRKSHWFLNRFRLDPSLITEIEKQLKLDNVDDFESAYWLWDEDIFYYFNDICPDGFYFGTSEGDGACFGFWKVGA